MTNPVEVAVERVGGAAKAARLLGLSRQAVVQAVGRGCMPNTTPEQRRRLLRLAKASAVPVVALAGLAEGDRPGTARPAA